MKYVSLDIETTGLDPVTCQILEIGLVLEDTAVTDVTVKDLPTFHCYVSEGRNALITGQPYALHLNQALLYKIFRGEWDVIDGEPLILVPGAVFTVIFNWLTDQGFNLNKDRINIAGKNAAGFDMQFLKQLPNQFWNGVFRHRVIDPAHYWLEAGDECMPDTRTCYKRAGMDEVVAHTAVEDAQSVIELLRRAHFGT